MNKRHFMNKLWQVYFWIPDSLTQDCRERRQDRSFGKQFALCIVSALIPPVFAWLCFRTYLSVLSGERKKKQFKRSNIKDQHNICHTMGIQMMWLVLPPTPDKKNSESLLQLWLCYVGLPSKDELRYGVSLVKEAFYMGFLVLQKRCVCFVWERIWPSNKCWTVGSSRLTCKLLCIRRWGISPCFVEVFKPDYENIHYYWYNVQGHEIELL